MGAFGIVAITPSTSTADYHRFGFETERTAGYIFAVFSDDETTRRLDVQASGDVLINQGGYPLATTATAGFLYIPGSNGVPTGTPAFAASGLVPLCYDYANDDLYIYNAGWVKVSLS